jgi:hypothetical protein
MEYRLKQIYRYCKTTTLGLGTIVLMACFSVDQDRDTSKDAWDKPMGTYPTQIQGLNVDPNGDLHIAVNYVHLFTPSQPDPDHFGVRSRNTELRIFTLSRGKWDSLAFQNWNPYDYTSSSSFYGYSNAFNQDQDGFPWIAFLDTPMRLARLQNRHWIQSKQWNANSYNSYSYPRVENGDLQCGENSRSSLDGEIFQLCLTTRDTIIPGLTQNGLSARQTTAGSWSSLYIQGSRTPPVLSKSNFGAFIFYSITLQGDTLNAFAYRYRIPPVELPAFDTNEVAKRDTAFWVRSVKSKSLKDSLPTWTTEIQALNPDYTPSRFIQVGNKLHLVVYKEALLNDSTATLTWQMDKMKPRFSFSSTRDNKSQQDQGDFTLDPKGCGHFMSPLLAKQKWDIKNNPIDTDLTDTGSIPTKKIAASPSIFVSDTLIYRNICQDGEDTLASTSPDTSENGYARVRQTYGTAGFFKFLVAADSLGQPWLIRNYLGPNWEPRDVYYSPDYNSTFSSSDFTQDPYAQLKEWRAKFRFDLQVREGAKWKTIALPFK